MSSMKPPREIPEDLLGGPGFRVALCVLSAIAFGAGLYRGASEDVGTEFFAAYVLEMCMSAENLFAIFLVFRYFKVPAPHQEHVLWWGLGVSAVLRGIVIISGGLFIAAQREAILIFAVVVIYSGYRLAVNGAPEDLLENVSLEGNPVISTVQGIVPVSDYYDGLKFVTTSPLDGTMKATPLFLVLIIVELTDLIFALDNVPALFSIVPSGNVVVIYAATLFGIAGLRSLYSLVARALPGMAYLQRTTGAALILIGARTIADYFNKGHIFPPLPFLGVLVIILVGGILLSVWEGTQTDERAALRANAAAAAAATRQAMGDVGHGGIGGGNGQALQAEMAQMAHLSGGMTGVAMPPAPPMSYPPGINQPDPSSAHFAIRQSLLEDDFPPARPGPDSYLQAGVQPLPSQPFGSSMAYKMTAQD